MEWYGQKAKCEGASDKEPQQPWRNIKEKYVGEPNCCPRQDVFGYQAGANDDKDQIGTVT
jgi:hypothetical protein